MQVVDECRMNESASQTIPGQTSMVHLSPSHRDDSMLNVPTVQDHQSFHEIPHLRSNSLAIVEEENEERNKKSILANSQQIDIKKRLATEKKTV